MSDYFLAPSLVNLRNELNVHYPHRDKASDGWIGDARHQAESYSDHNPCWSCSGKLDGVVRALDIDNDGAPGELTPLVKAVLEATVGDSRVWYVIWNRKIYSRTHGWGPLAYAGTDPHTNHIHVSIQGHDLANQSGSAAIEAAFSEGSWLAQPKKPIPTLPTLSVSNVKEAYRHPKKAFHPAATKKVQRALNAHGAGLAVDGVFGRSTRTALKRYKRDHNIGNGDSHPGSNALAHLGKNRWRLVK